MQVPVKDSVYLKEYLYLLEIKRLPDMNRDYMKNQKLRNIKHILLFTAVLCTIFILFSIQAFAAAPKYSVRIGRRSMFTGEQQQIETRGSKIKYTFKSSSSSVLSVSSKGLLRAKSSGKAVITVKANWKYRKKEYTRTKRYKITVTTLALASTNITLNTGDTCSIGFNKSIGSRSVQVTSGNSDFVKVSGRQLQAVYPGTTTVTVKAGDYVTLTANVTVLAKELPTVYVKLLLNSSGIHSSYDIADAAKKETGNVELFYTFADPSKGSVSNGVYRTRNRGQSIVAVTGGGYRKHFVFTTYSWSAHRGYLDIRPENTVDAFEMAGISGADMVETDIRLTKDGIPVCFHNASVNVMTDGTGKVAKKTYADLRKLTIDNGNGLTYTNNAYIPTLDQYLQIIKKYRMTAYVELKTWSNSDEIKRSGMQKIYSSICKYGLQGSCIIASYSADQLKLFCDVNGTNTGIPLVALDSKCYTAANAYQLPLLSYSQGTKFGTHTGLDYSPLIGRTGKSWRTYYASAS